MTGFFWKYVACTVVAALLLLSPTDAFAQSLKLELDDESPSFLGYRYEIFAIEDLSRDARIILRAVPDAYLIVRSPSGAFATNDDHSFDVPKTGDDAGLVITQDLDGRWLVFATTLSPSVEGSFELEVIGNPDPVTIVEADAAAQALVEEAFGARGIESVLRRRERKVDELVEQLSLPSYRANLDRLIVEREEAPGFRRPQDVEAQVEAITTELSELQAAREAAGTLGEHRERILDLIAVEIEEQEGHLKAAGEALEAAVVRTEALRVLRDRLRRLDAVAEQIAGLEQEVLRSTSMEQLRDIRDSLSAARQSFDDLARELAHLLLDSNVVRPQRFGGLAPTLVEQIVSHWTGGLGSLRIGGGITAGTLFGGGGISDGHFPLEPRVEYRALLPKLLPWPPPTPSARGRVSRSVLEGDAPVSTLGDAAERLREALRPSGYTDLGFYGVPAGFAIVTRIEQTDHEGRPLADEVRWGADRIQPWKRFTLEGYLRALLTAEPGYFRVIVLVVSSQTFSADDRAERLETIRRWAMQGKNDLPYSERRQPFTADHNVTVIVYEFEKRRNSADPEVRVPGRNSSADHLAHTRFARHL